MMKVWAYIHPEKQILCCALLKEAIPEGVEAVEFEVESPDDVILSNGEIRLKTQKEKLQEEKTRKLQYLKEYTASLLTPTDYVLIKLKEAEVVEGDVEELKQKYADVLAERQAVRLWSKEMKNRIKNAQTIEDVRSIVIEFTK